MRDKHRDKDAIERAREEPAAGARAIRSVLICGFGVMGRGVAATFAAAGLRTLIHSRRAHAPGDVPPGARVVAHLDELRDERPDLAVEFVPEDIAAKAAVFRQLEAAFPGEDMIIATGTSGLDLVRLAAHLDRPRRFVGMHYFMPADASPMVEVMAGPQTPSALVDRVAEAVAATGKDALRLYKPTIGFVVNRLQHAILHEAYCLIEAGVTSAEEIDRAARVLLAPRMCLNGLIRQKDLSGLAIHAAAQRSIVPALHHSGVPSPMLQAMVARGETGIDAGRGFYDWTGVDAGAERNRASRALAALQAFLATLPGGAAPAATRTADDSGEAR